MIKFPIIKVRDKDCEDGYEMYVGSNHHHILKLDENGSIKFHNIQCCDGTGKHGTYEFVTKKGCWGKEIQFTDIFGILDIIKEEKNIVENGLLDEYEKAINNLKEVFEKANNIKKQNNERSINEMFDKYFEEDNEVNIEEKSKDQNNCTKIIICGDRNWQNYDSILNMVKRLKNRYENILIIEGECDEADVLAKKAAIECQIR